MVSKTSHAIVVTFTFSSKSNKVWRGNLAKAALLFYHIRQVAAGVAMFVLRDGFATPIFREREVVGVSDGGPLPSAGIDLKELGGQLPKCLKFCPGIEGMADFHSKVSVCTHEMGGNPPTIPTLPLPFKRAIVVSYYAVRTQL